MTSAPLILASSSVARRELLERLGVPFTTDSPDIDESPQPGEPPEVLSLRLATSKATAVAARCPEGAIIIGSDQVAWDGEDVLGKPGSVENAVAQLEHCSGRAVTFFTAWCVIHDGESRSGLDRTEVEFRALTRPEIERYVQADEPLVCAGAVKAELLGISLFRAIRSTDPTALIGLPLITVSAALRDFGLKLP